MGNASLDQDQLRWEEKKLRIQEEEKELVRLSDIATTKIKAVSEHLNLQLTHFQEKEMKELEFDIETRKKNLVLIDQSIKIRQDIEKDRVIQQKERSIASKIAQVIIEDPEIKSQKREELLNTIKSLCE